MSPGIGLIKRRLEKERDAVSLAVSGVAKKYGIMLDVISTLETKYDDDSGDWYVALGWDTAGVIVRIDSIQRTAIDKGDIESVLPGTTPALRSCAVILTSI